MEVLYSNIQNAVSLKDKTLQISFLLVFPPMAWSVESKKSWPEANFKIKELDKLLVFRAQNSLFSAESIGTSFSDPEVEFTYLWVPPLPAQATDVTSRDIIHPVSWSGVMWGWQLEFSQENTI